jgi:hypothetical protein
MILVKGHQVAFDLEDGREVNPPLSWGMMHDPQGRDWNRSSVLVGPYRKGRVLAEASPTARDYFGATASVRQGAVTLPPRSKAGWTLVGRVARIWYVRTGTRLRGPFKHRFNAPGLGRLFFGRREVVLYKGHGFYRVELGGGATLDHRGFVAP